VKSEYSTLRNKNGELKCGTTVNEAKLRDEIQIENGGERTKAKKDGGHATCGPS
jgi:hypothetical protein